MQTIEPYQVLVIFRDGVVIAAQHCPQKVIRDTDGTVLLREPLPAEPIPNDIGETLLGQIAAGLTARVVEVEADLAEAVGTIAVRDARIAELEAALAAGIALVQARDARIAELEAAAV